MTDRPRVGDEPSGEAFRQAADERLRGAYDPPMSLESYVDRVIQNPLAAASGARYIVAAIESQGTRTVTERGETRSRYRFFDDPANDGEHAVLGNTAALNAFVDDLRAAASGRGNDETIVWIDGPTATGKSEFKRCLVNGLRAFSQTEQGRRYTIEWNVTGVKSADRSLSYGDGGDAAAWYQSPVQTQPLAVFPRAVRESIAEAAGEAGSGAVGEAVGEAAGEAASGAVGESASESASKAAGEAANDKTPKETSPAGVGIPRGGATRSLLGAHRPRSPARAELRRRRRAGNRRVTRRRRRQPERAARRVVDGRDAPRARLAGA